jgi:hypothetical protein
MKEPAPEKPWNRLDAEARIAAAERATEEIRNAAEAAEVVERLLKSARDEWPET